MLKVFKKKEGEVIEEELEKEVEKEVEEEKVEEVNEGNEMEKLTERINDLENKTARLEVSINGLKREMDGLKEQLKKMDDTLKDVMVLYEVVSAKVNPFVNSDNSIYKKIEMLKRDILLLMGLDLDRIIDEVLYGG